MNYRYFLRWLALLVIEAISINGYGQCEATVPTISINLTGNPDSTWTLLESNAPDRNGHCCAVTGSRRCIHFDLTLDPNTAGILFSYDGAPAFGTLTWQLDCGPEHNLRDTICVSGTGPHSITFCKSGSDNGNYTIQAVARPTFPGDQIVPKGCIRPLEALGVTTNSITWTSIYPGAQGQYNYMMSCTNCINPVFTPDPNGPDSIRYKVCGYPLLDFCTGHFTFCDTFAISVLDSIKVSVNPPSANFCTGGSATMTAQGSGGDGNFSYFWYDGSMNLLSTTPVFTTSVPGTFTVEVRDGNYVPGRCSGALKTVSIGQSDPPTANAGVDQRLCATAPSAILSGSVANATGGSWSGGLGSYIPTSTSTIIEYVPAQSEIANGSVTLILTSTGYGQGCSASSDQVTIFYSDTMETNLANLLLNCKNDSILVNPLVTGGTSPLQYQWNTGATTAATYLQEGNFCMTVTDQFGCNMVACMSISAPPSLVLNMSSTATSANGSSDGTASVAASGGTPVFGYVWNTGSTASSLSGVPAGIYTVTATDSKGCVMYGSTVVNEPRCLGFDVGITGSNVLCHTGSSGSATLSTIGGQSPFSILWSDPSAQTTPTASGLESGAYSVQVTDNNGCIAIETIVIHQPDYFSSNLTATDATTVGGSDGTANAFISGGTTPYSLLWSNGSTVASLTNLATGLYHLTITDGNGCTHSDSVIINEPTCTNYVAITGTTDLTCHGAANGAVNLSLVNGVGPYAISWSTGITNVTSLSGLTAGGYSVIVTDSRNCVTFRNFTITQPDALSLAIDVTPVSCHGLNDGTIDLSVAGGTFPLYFFSWSNGSTTEDVIHLPPGSYTAQVTDNNGCTASITRAVTEPAPLQITNTTSVDVSCFGLNNAAIDITVAGGVTPYGYSWSNGATTQDLTGIGAGGYLLDIRDANNCHLGTLFSMTILEPDSLVTTTSVTSSFNGQPVSCHGSNDGTAATTTSGGTAPYTYTWSNGQTTAGATGLFAGSYSVVVTDTKGCSAESPVVLTQPTSISMTTAVTSAYNGQQISCNGLSDGSTLATVTGGTPAYSYSWLNAANAVVSSSSTAGNLAAGSYTVTVTDLNGCMQTIGVILSEPPALSGNAVIASNYNGAAVSCHGLNDANLSILASGGTPVYSYALFNAGNAQVGTGPSPGNLGAGSYSATITDLNGCSVQIPVVISEPLQLAVSAQVTSDYNGQPISCNGLSDGSTLTAVTGGTPTYSYSWMNAANAMVSNSATAGNLGAGNYTVTVTDLNGCSQTIGIALSQPPVVSGTLSITSDYNGTAISCHGQSDASLSISASGGAPAYSYALFNTGNTQVGTGASPGNLGAGSYSAVITDLNGCSMQIPVVITEPLQLEASAQITSDYNGQPISCNGLSDGSTLAAAIGGTPGYSYSWMNALNAVVSTSATAGNLGAGSYTVTVTDLNGCSQSVAVILSEPTVLSGNAAITSNYNGAAISCNGLSDAALLIGASGGVSSYDFTLLDVAGNTAGTGNAPGNLSAGSYTAVITDLNGCTITIPVTINEPGNVTASAAITSDYNGQQISCHGLSDGAASAMAAGGIPSYTFIWLNPAGDTIYSGNNPTSLAAGQYTIHAYDLNGCMAIATVEATEPPLLSSGISNTVLYNGQQVSCFGYSNAGLGVDVIGGTPPYGYEWTDASHSPISGDSVLNAIPSGGYNVLITDANGCLSLAEFTVLDPPQLVLDNEVSNATCNDLNNGSIHLITQGGTGELTYQWSNGASGQSLDSILAGVYSVVVVDLNGCIDSIGSIVVNPTNMSLSAQIASPTCYHFADGSVQLTATGGAYPYTFLWSTSENSQNISGLSAGTYSVSVADSNHCVQTLSCELVEPDSLAMTLTANNVLCYAGTEGAASAQVLGGTPPYTYLWNTGSNGTAVSGLGEGTYSVVVQDAHHCQNNDQVTIAQPDSLWGTMTPLVYANGYNTSFTGESDGSINLVVYGGSPVYTYDWSDGTVTEDVSGLTAGVYSVLITDQNGCKYSLSDSIRGPLDFMIPEVFSPNGDAINDLFVIRGIEQFPENDLTIFNRWGAIVFETANYQNNWDGRSHNQFNIGGDELPTGVYFYVFNYSGKSAESVQAKGSVLIKR